MYLALIAALVLLIVLSNVLFWPRVRAYAQTTPEVHTAQVSVLIPARDEEANLPGCIQAITTQGALVKEILVYDDHSQDRTSAVVRSFAAGDERVRLLPGEPLPTGWCGKTFACARLASSAESEWLLFLDADTRLSPGAVTGILATAAERKVTLLSCWPGLDLIGVSERVLMPMLNAVVFTIFPAVLSLVQNRPSLGLAHGACLLARRDVYRRMGGHGAVYNEIFEDTRLAQWWRRSGERALCLDGQDVVRVRMYAGFSQIWLGFQKNFFPAFRTEWVFWCFLLFHAAVFLLPFVMFNWIAAGLILAARALLCIRFRQPVWSVLLHPICETVMLLLGVSSWWRCRSGRGVAWKGRVYRASTRGERATTQT